MDRVVVITGASAGVGAALAPLVARHRMPVVLVAARGTYLRQQAVCSRQ